MVRNDQFAPIGAFAQAVAASVNEAMAASGVSGNQLSKELGRAQSYVSARTRGKTSWTLDEVDQIAHYLWTTFDAIIESASKHISGK